MVLGLRKFGGKRRIKWTNARKTELSKLLKKKKFVADLQKIGVRFKPEFAKIPSKQLERLLKREKAKVEETKKEVEREHVKIEREEREVREREDMSMVKIIMEIEKAKARELEEEKRLKEELEKKEEMRRKKVEEEKAKEVDTFSIVYTLMDLEAKAEDLRKKTGRRVVLPTKDKGFDKLLKTEPNTLVRMLKKSKEVLDIEKFNIEKDLLSTIMKNIREELDEKYVLSGQRSLVERELSRLKKQKARKKIDLKELEDTQISAKQILDDLRKLPIRKELPLIEEYSPQERMRINRYQKPVYNFLSIFFEEIEGHAKKHKRDLIREDLDRMLYQIKLHKGELASEDINAFNKKLQFYAKEMSVKKKVPRLT